LFEDLENNPGVPNIGVGDQPVEVLGHENVAMTGDTVSGVVSLFP